MTAAHSRLAGGALAAVGVLMVVATAVFMRKTYDGDPTIYLPYARNLAHGHLFEYNVGEFSSGATSPLWAAVLAFPYLLGLGAGGAKAVAAAFTILAYVVTLAAARRAGGLLGAATAALFLVVALTREGVLMFESSLIVALVALTVLAGERVVRRYRDGAPPGPRELLPLALLWAAIPLARPEASLLVPLEVLALWRLGLGGGVRNLWRLVAAAAAAAVPALAYYGYSLAELGTPSTSAQGRAFQFHEMSHHRLGPLYLSGTALDYVTSRPAVWVFAAALIGVVLLARGRAERWLALYAGGGVLVYLGLLTFVTPGSYDTGRYLLPIAPLALVAAARALRELEHRWLTVPLLVLVTAFLFVDAVRIPRDAHAQRGNTYDLATIAHRDAARVVNARATSGDVVLAYEVQVRYFLRDDLRVLSLDGITDGKVARYAEDRDITAFLLRYRPTWWILDTSTDPLRNGVGGRPYLRRSPLGAVARRFIEHPRLDTTHVGGIRFSVVLRRPGALPYRFGAWRMVVRIDYPRTL